MTYRIAAFDYYYNCGDTNFTKHHVVIVPDTSLYSLTDTGRVIHKIHPKRLTGMRRKAKKLALILSEKDFDDWFRSWFNGHCHYMSKLQRSNMLDLCKKLKEEHYYGKTDFS